MSQPEAAATTQPGPEEPAAKPRPFQFSIRQMLFCVALFALVFGMLTWSVRSSREASRRAMCVNKMKCLGLALLNYHDQYGCFPPAYLCDEDGKPMHSWRVLILPEIEEGAVYQQYDFSEPWNGPNNRRLESAIQTSLFRCPSAGLEGTPLTSYVAVVGPDTMWPGSESTKIKDRESYRAGPQKIMLIEIADSDIHWMEPRDLTFDDIMASVDPEHGKGLRSPHPCGVFYTTANNMVLMLDHDIDAASLRELLLLEKTDSAIVKVGQDEGTDQRAPAKP